MACVATSMAQDTIISRPVTASYSVEWGQASALDTYLSSLRYDGTSLAVTGEWLKAMKQNPQRLIMAFDASLYGFLQQSPTRNSNLYNFGIGMGWGIMYRWQPISGLQLAGGGGLAMDVGVLYLSRNSNNPASARASLDFLANGMASYSFRIGKQYVRLIDRVILPVVGAFFSPDYGETYYEIYLGNHSGLVHCGWWGNHFCISNLLAADIHLGNVSLRIGYRLSLRSSYVNNINTRLSSHSLVVGVTSDWLNISKCKSLQTIIPAIY